MSSKSLNRARRSPAGDDHIARLLNSGHENGKEELIADRHVWR